jgi:hypothetical protein
MFVKGEVNIFSNVQMENLEEKEPGSRRKNDGRGMMITRNGNCGYI